MPFEVGNVYGRNVQLVTQTLRRAAMADDGKLLRQACDKALRAAADGDLQALAWVADRLDGKAIARSEATGSDARSLSLQDVAKLIYQARAASSEDAVASAPSTDAAESQPPGG
jgi:hypothetical protein